MIAELKEKVEKLESLNARLAEEVQSFREDMKGRVEEATREKIIEKERYIAGVEEECDAKVANKDVIIHGLEINLANANKRIQSLEEELRRSAAQRIEAGVKKEGKGFLKRLFGVGR